MTHSHKGTNQYLLIVILIIFTMGVKAQNQSMISYAYDNAGNRISRKTVLLTSNPPHVKKDTIAPAPVEEQLGERKLTVYPNPTKGELKVDITGGNNKDEIRILLFSGKGVQLQSRKVSIGTTPIDMTIYPPGWYILQVKAGDKVTELKIIKQ